MATCEPGQHRWSEFYQGKPKLQANGMHAKGFPCLKCGTMDWRQEPHEFRDGKCACGEREGGSSEPTLPNVAENVIGSAVRRWFRRQ